MNEQEIIDYLKSNTSAYCLMPKECQEYLVGKPFLWLTCHNEWQNEVPIVGNFTEDEETNFTYRLPPDYEPTVRYWLDTIKMEPRKSTCAIHAGFVEITKAYYNYLNNKPDGECELRIVKRGDTFFCLGTSKWIGADYDFKCADLLYDRGYRWCKIKGKRVERSRYYLIVDKYGSAYVSRFQVFGSVQNLEITQQYAEDLRNKPHGDLELKMVKVGDVFWGPSISTFKVADFDFSGAGTSDRGYRWCKIKPQGKWVEYDVKLDEDNNLWYIEDHPLVTGLHGAMEIKGFGGIQWRLSNGKLSDFRESNMCYRDPISRKLCDPVSVRFWEGE